MGHRVGHRRCRIVSGIKNKNMKNSLMIKWFTGRRLCQISQTILHGRDAILRVRDKLLISNIILQLWADVKYHVPTGFFVVKRRVVFILLARQKAVFYVFCFGAPSIYPQNCVNPFFITDRKNRPFGVWEGVGGNKKASFERRLLVTPEGLEPSTHWLRVNCSTNWATESWCLFVSELRVQSYDNFWNLQKKSAFFSKKVHFLSFFLFFRLLVPLFCAFLVRNSDKKEKAMALAKNCYLCRK